MNRTDTLLAMVEKDDAYTRGMLHGLSQYAWWKDGVQYVGTTGTTLIEALERALPRQPLLRRAREVRVSTVADLDGATLALTDASVALASLYPIMAVAPVPQEARGFIEDGMEALTRARRHLNELRPALANNAGHSVRAAFEPCPGRTRHGDECDKPKGHGGVHRAAAGATWNAEREHYPALCRVCGHSWEAADEDGPCPECGADGIDVAFGPLTTWVVQP